VRRPEAGQRAELGVRTMATVTRNGITLHYEVSGSGPAIVLTHSFLCDGSLFTHQVAALDPPCH